MTFSKLVLLAMRCGWQQRPCDKISALQESRCLSIGWQNGGCGDLEVGAVGEPRCKRQLGTNWHRHLEVASAAQRCTTACVHAPPSGTWQRPRWWLLPAWAAAPPCGSGGSGGWLHACTTALPGVGGAAGLPHACVRRRIARAAALVAGAGLRLLPCFCLSLLQQMAASGAQMAGHGLEIGLEIELRFPRKCAGPLKPAPGCQPSQISPSSSFPEPQL